MSEPKALRLKLHAVRCVYDAHGKPITNGTPKGYCQACRKPYAKTDEKRAWLVRPFYETDGGQVLEIGRPRWACHDCLLDIL